MSKYRIILDGKTYEMEVEKIDGSKAVEAAKPAAAAAPAPAVKPAAGVASPAAAQPAGDNTVVSPMPGTVLKVYVTEGDTVKQGQQVLVLEAMKMENEIVAPKAGRIAALRVKQGDAVQGGAVLFEIGE